MSEKASVVIVAAGSSRRMLGRNKLWTPLMGRITLARTLDVFQASALIESIVIVTSTERLADTLHLSEKEHWHKVIAVVPGGLRRQDSVAIGLDTLATRTPSCQWVMIHDAARPFVTPTMLQDGLLSAQTHQASVAAVPVKDTIKQVRDNIISTHLTVHSFGPFRHHKFSHFHSFATRTMTLSHRKISQTTRHC